MAPHLIPPEASQESAAPDLPFDLSQPYGLAASVKDQRLLKVLQRLGAWHQSRCAPYRRIVEHLYPGSEETHLADLPFLPVRLFKTMELVSAPQSEIVKTLTSSGTTSQTVSRVYLDRETSVRQTRVLSAIMADFLGSQRLPMIIVDSEDLLRDRTRFNARAAGILGFSFLGRNHFYCLDADLQLREDELRQYLAAHAGEPLLVFGFTFVVWQALVRALSDHGRHLDFGARTILLHGGGWKRLTDQQVSNYDFKRRVQEAVGITRVHNYYGMIEQVGSIYMECEFGFLHSPVFSDVIVRDPLTLEPCPPGQEGVLQVLSALPLSYPGHSLLTEDTGVVHGVDDCRCGRLGRYFTVHGRLPQAEIRGCSDTRVVR